PMWRWGGGRLKPPAESNSSVPSTEMRPRSGASRPATMLTIDVLPEPEGPNSAVTPSGASNFAAMLNPPSRFSTSTASMSAPVQPGAGAAREPFGRDERNQRNDDGENDERRGRRVAAGNLQIGIDRRRDGLRLARDVRDERDGGAELTERLGEAQDHAGDDAGERERQCHGQEHAERVGAERAASVFQPRIDRLN